MIRGTSNSKFTLEWTGTQQAFILATHDHSGGLESLDVGDALGYWEQYMRDPANDPQPVTREDFPNWESIRKAIDESELFDRNGFTFKTIIELPGGVLIMDIHQGLYQWEGLE